MASFGSATPGALPTLVKNPLSPGGDATATHQDDVQCLLEMIHRQQKRMDLLEQAVTALKAQSGVSNDENEEDNEQEHEQGAEQMSKSDDFYEEDPGAAALSDAFGVERGGESATGWYENPLDRRQQRRRSSMPRRPSLNRDRRRSSKLG